MSYDFTPPLDSRSKSILSLLLKSKGPLTAAQIANELAITPRMVNYRLKQVEYWLDERKVELVTKPNYGSVININEHARKELELELECSSAGKAFWWEKTRWKAIVFHLLTNDGATVIKQLQAITGVSRPTLIADMNKASKWLENFNLVLVRKPGFGITIEGEERSLREATVCLILDNINKADLQAYLDYSKRSQESDFEPHFEDCIGAKRYLKDLNLKLILRHLHNLESQLSANFTGTTWNYLSLLIAITIQRSRKGHFINHFHVDNKIESTIEYIAAERVYSLFEKEFRLIFPSSETHYLAINLAGAKTTDPQTALSNTPSKSIVLWDPLDIISDFLSQVSLYLHPIIRVDRQLKQNLTLHLKPALVRLRYGLPIRNPLLHQIKADYPYLFKITRECSGVIEERINRRIPDEELGYIVMHLEVALERLVFHKKPKNTVLLVCGSGISTVLLMASKMNRLFPDIIIKDILPAAKIPHEVIYFDNVDFVVSTVPLDDLGVPIITVSPLLEECDQNKIREMLKSGLQNSSSPVESRNNGPSLVDLISVGNIGVNIHVKCWPEVIEEAGKLLLMSGSITSEYIVAMKEVIHQYGPYVVIAPGVALLHARPEQGVKSVCMSLITLDEPINFGHPDFDPVKLAFVLGATDDFKHINALQQLAFLLRDKKKIKSICEAKSKEEIIQFLHEYISCLDHSLKA